MKNFYLVLLTVSLIFYACGEETENKTSPEEQYKKKIVLLDDISLENEIKIIKEKLATSRSELDKDYNAENSKKFGQLLSKFNMLNLERVSRLQRKTHQIKTDFESHKDIDNSIEDHNGKNFQGGNIF